jgi:hypothetical protein
MKNKHSNKKIVNLGLALVAHTCNPSYSGGRDQEDRSSKPAQENGSTRPYVENTHHKNRTVGVAKVKALSSNPSTTKKKKRKDCQFGKIRPTCVLIIRNTFFLVRLG